MIALTAQSVTSSPLVFQTGFEFAFFFLASSSLFNLENSCRTQAGLLSFTTSELISTQSVDLPLVEYKKASLSHLRVCDIVELNH